MNIFIAAEAVIPISLQRASKAVFSEMLMLTEIIDCVIIVSYFHISFT